MTDDELRAAIVALGTAAATPEQAVAVIEDLMGYAVPHVNAGFCQRQLSKLARPTEMLPTHTRQLSSYRTRLGTMLEYGLSTVMDQRLAGLFGEASRMTFAVAHEFPDFYLRGPKLKKLIHVEMKACDADSEEQASRFELLKEKLAGHIDIVALIGWHWRTVDLDGASAEFPEIFRWVVMPAVELIDERDRSVKLRGGKVTAKGIFVPSKKTPGKLAPDQHNAGKILRLVHQDRIETPEKLSLHIRRYLDFVTAIKTEARARLTLSQGFAGKAARPSPRAKGRK